MYLKRIINCVIKGCKILDSLVIIIFAIATWLATTMMSVKIIVIVTIQLIIVMVPITSFITTTCNFITTSGDDYKNITIGNLVNTNKNRTTSTQSSMIILEDSFIEITIAELIKLMNNETTIAPIKIYTMTSSTISIIGWFAALTKLWSD